MNMEIQTSNYPRRIAYFAHRYCRLLTKTCAAQEIGHVAFALCVTIAHQEDAKRYAGPVTFFNEQLMPLVAITKWESLDRARQRAVQAGWLHYDPGNRGQRMPGRYWVTIPTHMEGVFDDKPCDENQYPENGYSVKNHYPKNGEWQGSQPPAKGEREGEREGEHSTLTLNINNTRFIKPTFEEVKAYCEERHNKVDPQQFIDHYEARGWKFKGGQFMKDWRAAIRTWEKNNFNGPTATVKPEPVKYRG